MHNYCPSLGFLQRSPVSEKGQAEMTLHDIALVRVKETIVCRDKVSPVNLPSREFDVKKDMEKVEQIILVKLAKK